MKIIELVTAIKNAKPELFTGIKNAAAVALIREAFAQVKGSVVNGEEEIVKVAGLGVFKTIVIEREVEGKLSKQKRTIFRAASPKR